jgi:anti-sigma factor RsiW
MRWNDLTCQELVELVTDYLEQRILEAERARFEAHLAICGDCRAYVAQMRATVRLLGRLPITAPSEAARRELLALFRHWRRSEPNSNGQPSSP